jgi:hypothetical protein
MASRQSLLIKPPKRSPCCVGFGPLAAPARFMATRTSLENDSSISITGSAFKEFVPPLIHQNSFFESGCRCDN